MKRTASAIPTLVTRRDFLKTSATATAVGALAALDVSRFAHAAGSDILKVGLIGCGGRNAGAGLQALTADPGARLVVMSDIFPNRIQETLNNIRARKPEQVQVTPDHCFTGFDGYQQVVAAADVVCIANAAKFHPLHVKAAVEAGKHVFVEKPHGIDPYGIKMLRAAVALAREKKLSLVSGLQSRYHEGYVETVKRIQEGAIGEIIAIEEKFLRAPYRVFPRPAGMSELDWQCFTQYHFTWLSGDDVPQSLIHNLDRVSWILGDTPPEKCHGLGGRSSMTDPIYGDVFDHHSVIYQWPNGVRVYAFCRTTSGCYDENSSTVLGTKGRAYLMQSRITGHTPWRWQGQCDPYQIEHDRLFAAIRAGQPLNNGDYMCRSSLITIMGQLSCYTGQEVTWEAVETSDFFFPPKPEDCRDDMAPPTRPGPDGCYPTPIPGRTRLLGEAPAR